MSLPSTAKIAGPAYLTQCACFDCRKVFKKDLTDPRYSPTCPECGATTSDLGRNFRAPKKNDAKQWQKVEMLFRAGIYFKNHEFGRLPNTVAEAKQFIDANRDALARSAHSREISRGKAVAALLATEEKRRLAREALMRKRQKASTEPVRSEGGI